MNKKSEYLLHSSIIVLFIALRITFITQKNLWFDEIFSWHIIQGSFYDIISRTSADIHPPLYYFTLKIWNLVFGDSVFSMRFLSTLFSVLTIFFIYPVSKRVLTSVFSILFLIFFAINPLNIFYSQEVRMSAMNLFLNAGSVYFLLRFLDREYLWLPDFHQNEYYLYVLFRTAALYTHYFSFIIFIAEIIYVFVSISVPWLQQTKSNNYNKDIGIIFKNFSWKTTMARFAPLALSFVSVILLYLPWLSTFIEHSTRGQSWRRTQTISMALHEVVNYIKDINMGLYYHYTDLRLVYYITIFLIIAYGFSLLVFLFSFLRNCLSFPRQPAEAPAQAGKRESSQFQYHIPFIFVIVPVLLGIIISLNQKVEFYRYFSIIIPFVLIFILFGLSKIHNKYIITPVLILLMFINIFGLTSQYSFNFKNDDYRPVINHIEQNFEAGDRIYVEPHYMGWSIDYYKSQWDLKLPNPVYIRYGWNEILDSLNIQKPNKFWVILDYSAVDTTKYADYIKGLNENNKLDERMTYYLAPSKVELYRFGR